MFILSNLIKRIANSNQSSFARAFNSTKQIKSNKLKKSGSLKIWVKTFIGLELIFLAGSYYIWRKMNTSQDFRFYMKNNFPTVLDGNKLL